MITFRTSERLAGLLGAALLFAAPVFAADDPAVEHQAHIESIREVLQSTQTNMEIGGIRPSAVEGLYEISIQNGQTLYASADGRYFLTGDLYEARPEGLVNLGELKRNEWRADRIAALDEDDMIVYEAEGERKATLTVFTDVDCPYCRKLHEEVPQLNEMGIAVRYLAYPRTGLNTETSRKMISTWCAEEPRSTLTSAKRGAAVAKADCDNPVAEQYQLGREVGVTGTPALVLEDGTIVPGYVPAQTLATYLLGSE